MNAIVSAMLLLSAGSAPASQPVQSGAGRTLRTEHYDLHVEQMEPSEVGAMLEQLHARLKGFFGRAPDERLLVRVYATRQGWYEALRADGHAIPSGGGYYAPSNGTVYVCVQPSAYYTRQLLLHEAVHQFHWLAAADNRTPACAWYYEGLAEFFAMHDWDGRTLTTGIVPAVTLEDYPARAAEEFDRIGGALEGILHGRVRVSKQLSWALVHFLMHRHADRFRELSRRLDRREAPAEAWKDAFGPVPESWTKEMADRLRLNAQPWEIVWIAWQQRGDRLEGSAAGHAVCVLKDAPRRLTVELEPVGPRVSAGLVVGFRDERDFHVAQVLEVGRFRVLRRAGARWETVKEGAMPAGGGAVVLSAEQDEGETVVSAGKTELLRLPVTGRMGLDVEGGTMRFRTSFVGSKLPSEPRR